MRVLLRVEIYPIATRLPHCEQIKGKEGEVGGITTENDCEIVS